MRYRPRMMDRLGWIAVVVVACGCNRGPTIGELKEQHRPLGEKLVAGVDAARALVEGAPPAAIGAPCAHAGLTPSRSSDKPEGPAAGNTEMLDAMWLKTGDDRNAATASPLNQKPMVGWGATASAVANWYQPSEAIGSASSYKADPGTIARYDSAAKVEHLLVARRKLDHIDVFLLDFPATKLECSFGVESPLDRDWKASRELGYDLHTGEPWKDEPAGAATAARDADVQLALAQEIQTRFGLSLGGAVVDAGSPAPGDPALEAEKARAAGALAAMGAKVPACKGPAPAAPRTTTKRLHLQAGKTPLDRQSLNVVTEASDLVSPEVRAFLTSNGDARIAAARALLAAPVWLVVDVVEARVAFETTTDKFTPGTLTARQIQIDAGGKAICETRVTVTNSEALDVTYRSGMKFAGVADASRADLLKNLGKQLAAAQ